MSSLSKIFGSAALFGLMQLQSGIGSLAPEVSGLKMNPLALSLTKIPTKVEDFDIQYSEASYILNEKDLRAGRWLMKTFRQFCLDSLNNTSEDVRLKALQKLDEVLNEEYFQITKLEAKIKIDAILKLLAVEKIQRIREAAFKTLLNIRFIELGVSFDEYMDKIVDVLNLEEDAQISTDNTNINYHDIPTDIYTETNAQKLLNMHAVTFAHGYKKLLHKVKEQQIQKDSDADADAEQTLSC